MRSIVHTIAWMLLGGIAVGCALFGRIAIVSGSSMQPALVRGDVCVTARSMAIGNGDIVLYRRPGDSPVLHRVIAIEQGGDLRTAGDANEYPDRDPVPVQHIKGRVFFVFPLGRAARNWMRCVRGATLLTQSS